MTGHLFIETWRGYIGNGVSEAKCLRCGKQLYRL